MTDIQFRNNIDQGRATPGHFVPKAERQKASNAFRATHFIMGKAPTLSQSTSSLCQAQVQKRQRPQTANNARSAALMQGATNFKLGDEIRPNQQYSTVYGSLMGNIDHSGPKQTQGDVFAKKTSVKFAGRNSVSTFRTTNGLTNDGTR